LLIRIEAHIHTVDSGRFSHQVRERLRIHHGLNAEIILDQRGHLKTDCPALRLQQIDLDQITQAYPKDLSEPGRGRQTAFGQPDWTQIDVDIAVLSPKPRALPPVGRSDQMAK